MAIPRKPSAMCTAPRCFDDVPPRVLSQGLCRRPRLRRARVPYGRPSQLSTRLARIDLLCCRRERLIYFLRALAAQDHPTCCPLQQFQLPQDQPQPSLDEAILEAVCISCLLVLRNQFSYVEVGYLSFNHPLRRLSAPIRLDHLLVSAPHKRTK